MSSEQNIISRRLCGVNFSYYNTQQVRKISVKEITNPVAFDQLGRPLQGGLYDPSMGVSPYDKLSRCVTCGQESLDCPGHLGHIELLLPVYNPFTVKILLKILRSKCFYCNKLRMSKDKIRQFENIFLLIHLGYPDQAKEYRALLERQQRSKGKQKSKEAAPPSEDTSRKSSAQTQTTAEKIQPSLSASEAQIVENFNRLESQKEDEKIRQILRLLKVKKNLDPQTYKHPEPLSHHNTTFEEFYKLFWSNISTSGKCPHCNKPNSAVRKEGSSKFFISSNTEISQQ